MKRQSSFPLFAAGLLATLAGLVVLVGPAATSPVHAAPADCVSGPHSGAITVDQTWCLVDSPHLLADSVTVAPGVVLMLEPGVTVMSGNNGNAYLSVEGRLEALGNEAQPITFTSQWDSGPEQWPGITFDGGTGALRHVTVRYAGRACHGCQQFDAAGIAVLGVQSGPVTIEASQVISITSYQNSDQGLRVVDGRVAVTDTLFSGIGNDPQQPDFPIYISGASSEVSLSGNRFENNEYDRVLLAPGAMTGHNFTLSPQEGLQGYQLEYSFTVPAGITLTIDPGVTVMSGNNGNAYLSVEGRLNALGTEAQPITFTSQWDSGPEQWPGITFDGGTGALRHVTVRYAGRACHGCQQFDAAGIAVLGVQSGPVTIEASQVISITSYQNSDQGLRVVDSRVAVTDTLFSGIGNNLQQPDFPIYISGASSQVSLSGNRFENNTYNRVLLAVGAMTGHDFTLTAQPGLQGFQLEAGFTVPAGIVMTVDPGVTVMAGNNGWAYLDVQGRLEAVGTEAQPIIFTSQWDSGPEQWPGITFDGGTGTLRHVTVRYAGRGCHGCQQFQSAGIALFGVQSGQVTIEASQVISITGYQNSDYGLYLVDSRVAVTDTLFSGIGTDPNQGEALIKAAGNSELSVSGSMLKDSVGDGLVVSDGAVRIQVANSGIMLNGRYGVSISGDTAVLTMTNSTVLANTLDGVRNNGAAQVTLGGMAGLGNTIMGNGGLGVNQTGAASQINATYNWWGNASGPYHPTLNPGGTGDEVSDRVLFEPWATDWEGTIPSEVFVSIAGPRQVSPGGIAGYTASYVNGSPEVIENAVLVVALPSMASYLDASGDGRYWAARHAVVWKLGSLVAGQSGSVAAVASYAWGLPEGSLNAVQARLGGTNLPLGLADVQAYLDFSPQELLGTTTLTEAQLVAERQAYPDLDLIYSGAEADGFLAGGAIRMALSATEPITQVVLLQPERAEVMYLRRQGSQVLASTYGLTTYAARSASGGMALDLQTGAETFWGAWGSDSTPSETGQSYSDCRFLNLPGSLLNDKLTQLTQVLNSATCYPCVSGGACEACFATLQQVAPLPEARDALACTGDAGGEAAGEPPPATTQSGNIDTDCPDDGFYVDCNRGWIEWTLGSPWKATRYPCFNGKPVRGAGQGEDVVCEKDQLCIGGGGYAADWGQKLGCVCPPNPLAGSGDPTGRSQGFRPFAPLSEAVRPAVGSRSFVTGCDLADPEDGTSRCVRTKVTRPKDPNAKYGLEGDLLPGQPVTYTITYENEGAGTAYGVFVADPLDESLDLATLHIYGPGQLVPSNRTILWTVGDLGPKGAPDAQGVVSFTVELLDGLPPGTAVINQATVYFPTVPEETPTNPIVNFVQPLAAVPQQAVTSYMSPVAITLAGRGPDGVPLSFAVVQSPLNGTLSGAAPDLVYTPAENMTGLDHFAFKVSDGTHESRPAEIQIVVNSSEADTTPPEVRWTFPVGGVTDVEFSARPVFTDSIGPVYPPVVLVQFSEAISPTTLTDQVVHMVDPSGHAMPTSVAYDATSNRAVIYLREPLQAATWYTVTVHTGVEDLAGNNLAGDLVWSFRAVQRLYDIFLPLMLRKF